MTECITADPVGCVAEGETRRHDISFANELRSGETLTGTPTVTEVSTSDLSLTSPQLNGSQLTIRGDTVSANEAVQVTVSGQLAANSPYTVKIQVDTTANDTLVRYFQFEVQAH